MDEVLFFCLLCTELFYLCFTKSGEPSYIGDAHSSTNHLSCNQHGGFRFAFGFSFSYTLGYSFLVSGFSLTHELLFQQHVKTPELLVGARHVHRVVYLPDVDLPCTSG